MDRIKILFVPFIISLLVLVAGYTFLHWLLSPVIALKDWLWLYVFPLVCTGLLITFYIYPKLKILKLDKPNSTSDWKGFYTFLLFFCLAVPTVIAQHYMVTAAGKLTELNAISEINSHKPTKYYRVKNYYIDKADYGFSRKFSVRPKSSRSVRYNFTMDIYFAFPVYNSAADFLSSRPPAAWLGRHFLDRIDNSLSHEEKNREYQKFTKKSIDKLNSERFYDFSYFEKIGLSEDYENFQEAIKTNNLYFQKNSTVLLGINKPFENRSDNSRKWLLITAGAGIIIWLLLIFIPKTDKGKLRMIKSGKPDRETIRARENFLNFITPRKNFWVLHLLVYSCLVLYLIMVLAGLGAVYFDGNDLPAWGALYTPLVKEGQVWRLLSYMFLHGGLMHLFNNMFGLVVVGFLLEAKIGSWRFLLSYLFTGILAGITSIWWHGAECRVVGASGAIFGMYGVLFALFLTKKYDKSTAGFMFVFAVINIALTLLMGMFGNIENAAHIGGLIFGFITGLCLSPFVKKIKKRDLG